MEDDIDYYEGEELSDEDLAAEECGRWFGGALTKSCTKAGTEQCDWDCPYRADLYPKRRKRRK